MISLIKNLDIYSGSHFGSQTETNYIKHIVTEREISIEKLIDYKALQRYGKLREYTMGT